MTSYKQDGKVGIWAKEKLNALSKYLEEYTKILRKRDWCRGFFYFDAFAGAGIAELRENQANTDPQQLGLDITSSPETKKLIEGSPLKALRITYPFTKYYFVEKSPKRVKQLQNLKAKYQSTRNIQIIQGEAVDAIEKFLNDPSIDWVKCRAVMFLDPFGMQVPWKIIKKIAATGNIGSIEILLNFPVGTTLQRLLPKSGNKISEEQEAKLNNYFGTNEWKSVLYESTNDLFGEDFLLKKGDSGKLLVEWYCKRLRGIFNYVPKPKLICNSRGGHLYYLIFAGPNATGAKIAKYILEQSTI